MTGGGSGGHITPLLSLARELKKRTPDCLIIYIGPKGDKLDRLRDEYSVFDEVYYVPAGKFRRYHGESLAAHLLDIKTLLLNGRDFFRVIAGIASSVKLLKRTSPNVVFSKGGFVAVPVGVAARLLRLPIVTHDSDVVPGLANRILSRWASVHTTGMPARHYHYPKNSTRYVGIPVDERFSQVDDGLQKAYKQELGLRPDQKVLLVSGGGLGAQSLNKTFVSAASDLIKHNPELAILHFTGSQNTEAVIQQYGTAVSASDMKSIQVIGFSPDFYKYTGAADLVITRAGATTLAELAVQAKACILVPSPFLTGGHQVKNARLLKEAGAVEVIPNNAAPSELFKKADELLNDDNKRRQLSNKLAATAKTDAAAALADILLELSTKSHA